jgi:hypothetical protein
MRKTAIGNARRVSQASLDYGLWSQLTVTKYELSNPSNVHSYRAKEVIIATQANKTLRRNSTLKATQNKNGRGIWDEEADQTKKCWITWLRSQLVHLCIVQQEAYRSV